MQQLLLLPHRASKLSAAATAAVDMVHPGRSTAPGHLLHSPAAALPRQPWRLALQGPQSDDPPGPTRAPPAVHTRSAAARLLAARLCPGHAPHGAADQQLVHRWRSWHRCLGAPEPAQMRVMACAAAFGGRPAASHAPRVVMSSTCLEEVAAAPAFLLLPLLLLLAGGMAPP